MYPFMRLWRVMRAARRRPVLAHPGEADEIRLRVWPWDIDPFKELNNGRTLTLLDLGRFALAYRAGLIAALRRRGWGLAVAGASVRWRRRVRAFAKLTNRTSLLGHDGRWFYIHQSIRAKGEPVSSALLRTAVTSPAGTVPAAEVMAETGFPDWAPELPGWVRAWAAAETERPWPPE